MSVSSVTPRPSGGPVAPATGRRGRLHIPPSLVRRPMLGAALIYAVLSIVMVGQGLLPGRVLSPSDFLYNDAPWQASRPANIVGIGANYELVDIADVFQPFLRYNRATFPSIPLWNPYISGGRPYLANGQSAVFSPFNLPAYVLPLLRSYAVIAALKLFLAALGMFALARRLGMRFGGALIAGMIFAFGTFFIVLLQWPETSIFPVLPWLLALCDVLVFTPTLLATAGAALLVSLVYFGGHPETAFHVIFATVVFFAFRLLVRHRSERGPPRELIRPLAAFAGAMVAGAAVAAVVIVPFGELLSNSNEYARRVAAGADHWPRKYLGALFLHDYWGRATQQSNVDPFMQVRGWYAGALTLMLAPVALFLRATLTRIAVALFALFSVAMVVGLPPVFTIVSKLPGFSSTHNEPMIIYCLLCLGLLAGWGLDELSSGPLAPGRRRTLVVGTAVAVFCVPFAWMLYSGTLTTHGLGKALDVAWGFADPPHPAPLQPVNGDIVRMSALLEWIVLAGAGLVLIVARTIPRRSRLPLAAGVFVALAAGLTAADLFRANMGFNPAIPQAQATVPATPAIRYLQAQRPNRFVGASSSTAFEPLPADLSMNFGLYDARGYDYPTISRYDTMWRRYVNNTPTLSQPTELANTTPEAIRALNLLSVADVMSSPGQPPLHLPGLSLAYRGPDAVVYRNTGALPRAFVVDRQQTVTSPDAALTAVTAAGFPGRSVAVTEHALPGLAQGAGSSAPGSAGTARLTRYGTDHVTIDATAPHGGLLVLTDVYFPGWSATVDGHSVPISQVDYLLRGIPIGPGHHRVELTYAPASFTVGWIVSVISLLATLVALGLGWRRHRRRRAGSGLELAGVQDSVAVQDQPKAGP